jgi:hypothetical protein
LGVTSLLALNVAKTGGVLLATLFRFWSYRTFVFQPVPQHAEETWHSIPRDEWDTMAEMDPVAELAESVSELEEAQQQAGRREPATEPVFPQPKVRPAPLDAGLGSTVGADLDAELAAELQVGTRRPRR